MAMIEYSKNDNEAGSFYRLPKSLFEDLTIEEMMKLLHYGNKKINETLKELEDHDLIFREHRGLGRPNRIYVNDILSPFDPGWKPKNIKNGGTYHE